MFVHAHGIASMNAEHAASIVADQVAVEAHCADHTSMAEDAGMEMSMVMPEHMTMDAEGMAAHNDSNPDCCQSLLCNCPCMQALALSLSLPYVPTALPDARLAQVLTTPPLYSGISGLFRPPI